MFAEARCEPEAMRIQSESLFHVDRLRIEQMHKFILSYSEHHYIVFCYSIRHELRQKQCV